MTLEISVHDSLIPEFALLGDTAGERSKVKVLVPQTREGTKKEEGSNF